MISEKDFKEIRKVRNKEHILNSTFLDTNYFQIKSNDLIACVTFLSFTFIANYVLLDATIATTYLDYFKSTDLLVQAILSLEKIETTAYTKCTLNTFYALILSGTTTILFRYIYYIKNELFNKIENKIKNILITKENAIKITLTLAIFTIIIHCSLLLSMSIDTYINTKYYYIEYTLITINTTLILILIEVTSKRFLLTFSLTMALFITTGTSIHLIGCSSEKTQLLENTSFSNFSNECKSHFVINGKSEQLLILCKLKNGYLTMDKNNSYRLIYNKCIDEIKLK
ncbi:hypothetical protein [Maridesulfovibrio sp.]|uniref:hypothetical protein n=1 Tax=Maridesulfovibrio sp. TaxID=2795000 RepID=UPI0029F49100|nr:hypothetical protein [Maridesulfovibrio sp.]